MAVAAHSRMLRRLAPVAGAVLFCVSVAVLARELESVGFAELTRALRDIPIRALELAFVLTIVNYATLTLQDQLAVTYAGIRIPRGQVTLASFIAYAISNSVGFAMLSGTSARYRFYSRWNIGPGDLSRIVLFYSVSFWIGLGLVAGVSLTLSPPVGLREMLPAGASVVAGLSILVVIAAYATLCVRGGSLRVWRFTLPLPSPQLMALQTIVSVVDWLLAASVFYVLLPATRPAFLPFAGSFAAAQLIGLASHVPGGLGVFDGVMVLLLRNQVAITDVAPALVAYRIIYYAVPLVAALMLLLLDETSQRRTQLSQFRRTCHALAVWATPRVLALFIFASGVMLLFSGATPAVAERLQWIATVMPLPLVEASHFTASLIGLLLLVLAQAIARRVDAAYYVTAAALAVGAGASLIKGADYEEAAILALVLLALLSARRHFTRRARILEWPLAPRWIAAIVTAIAASVWLGLFAYRHVGYTSDLWWRFAVDANAPRFLRASVGVTIASLVIAVRLLLGQSRPRLATIDLGGPTPDLDRVIALQPHTLPYLVYLGDKSVLWNDDRTAFVMYAVSGSTCVALGDPVGPANAQRDMVRRFVTMSDAMSLTPALYQVSPDLLSICTDASLTAIKLGEEGALELPGMSFAGARYKDIRTAMNRFDREGYTFSVLGRDGVAARVDELEEVSDDWLASKSAAEKGFSLGSFDAHYVSRFPAAVIERNQSLEAFATLWPGPGRVELSPDLMRHRRDAPSGVMDALFGHIILWARDQGYQRFNLGMAPLSGIDRVGRADAWSRVSQFIYRHGEPLYNFQGVRSYKDKFHPQWEPRYLAYPRGLALAHVLADVTALIAGGYRRILLSGVRRAA
jgi:phosphatidylglycerol lysyltransferase